MSQALELTGSPDVGANKFVMARNVTEALQKAYPGWTWAVNIEGGVINTFNFDIVGAGGAPLGCRAHLHRVYSMSSLQVDLIRMWGEVFEAYKLPRGRVNLEKVQLLPKMANGAPVFDPAVMKGKAPRYVQEAYDRTRGYAPRTPAGLILPHGQPAYG